MFDRKSFLLLVASSLLCTELPAQVPVENRPAGSVEGGVTLGITAFEARQDRLDIRYEVRNGSKSEIWLCDDIDVETSVDFETVASFDGSTLLIRLRLGMPMGWWRSWSPAGIYVRLVPGEHHRASIWFTLPVRQQPVLTSRSAHHPEQQKRANRLVLEVGYFPGDLSARVRAVIRDANEFARWQRVEVDRIMREEARLSGEYVELSKREGETTDTKEKEQLQKELEEVEAQQGRLFDAWALAYPASFYSASLGLEIPAGLPGYLEEINSDIAESTRELVVPHAYSQRVEKEHFVRTTLDNVAILHLPPRYLDLTQKVPWGKESDRQRDSAAPRRDQALIAR